MNDPWKSFFAKFAIESRLLLFLSHGIHGIVNQSCDITMQVAVINFSQTYSDYENPARVNVNNSSNILSMTVPHDIIMTDRLVETKVVRVT